MKRVLAFLFSILTTSLWAQSEIPLPKAPSKIEFANVVVNVDRGVQAKLDRLIRDLLTPENAFLDAKLERMQWYFPIIQQILKEEKVPDDLKYLAVMESNLYPDALSSSGAVGFWQFKTPTALEMDLRIDDNIDERKYIYASTKAAAQYFKKNQEEFHNWVMCIYAFNQGAGGAKIDLPKSWKYSSEVNFNRQTPEYLIKALANRLAFEYRLNRMKPSESTFIVYPTQNESLNDIAGKLNVDRIELANYNVWARKGFVPSGKNYNVLMPSKLDKAKQSLAKVKEEWVNSLSKSVYPVLKRITKVATSDEDPIFYRINNKRGILARPGNEAAQLATKGEVKLGSFLFFNDLNETDIIKTGQVYYLEKKEKRGPVKFHTTAPGQNLWDIAQIYGIRLKKLMKYNRVNEVEDLQPGHVVWLQSKRPRNQMPEIRPVEIEESGPFPIVDEYVNEEEPESPQVITHKSMMNPTSAPTQEEAKKVTVIDKPSEVRPTKEALPNYHVVQQGETLFLIAEKYKISVNKLSEINGLKASSVLQYGEILKLKGENVTYVRPVVNEPTAEKEFKEKPRPLRPAVGTKGGANYHSVHRGQTLYSISNMYGVRVEDLQNWNGISGTTIEVGQRLRVSADTGISGFVPQASSTHIVRAGDTLYSIAKRNGVTVQDLRQWNNLSSNDIEVGQNLRVK